MDRLRILIAAALVATLGYIVAFGSDYGAETAFARKNTVYSTSTSFAGNSSNVKGVVTSSTVFAGNTKTQGKGQIKTTGGSTTTCKPTGNKVHSCG